jgi:AraC-like DNA-binding protein
VTYREQRTPVAEAVLWQSAVGPAPKPTVILPDGCLDLIWDGHRLFVAGPDTVARRHQSPPSTRSAALRFSAGLGPVLLGVPADELRDQTVDLDQLWPTAQVRTLTDQVAANPGPALTGWLTERAADHTPDPLGPRVATMATAGLPVAAMADRLGLGVRQLHRKCQPVFGYGPRYLVRVLRLGRALESVRADQPLAEAAAGSGYCDQAHLTREVKALTGTTPTRLLSELGLRE